MRMIKKSMVASMALIFLVSIGGYSSPISNKDAVFEKLTTCKKINNEIEGYFFVDKKNW